MPEQDVFQLTAVPLELLNGERKRLRSCLQQHMPSAWIHEVGSTAVPGVIGKQDLDFLVRVPASAFRTTRAQLDQLFPRHTEQLSNDSYQAYRVPSPIDVAIQLTIENGDYDTFLVFLERLRASATLRGAYNQLKRRYDGRPMDEYRDAKAAFVASVLAPR